MKKWSTELSWLIYLNKMLLKLSQITFKSLFFLNVKCIDTNTFSKIRDVLLTRLYAEYGGSKC